MIKPILLFDLDGTISDPIEGIWRSFNYGLEAMGFPPLSREQAAACIGPPLDESFRAITDISDKQKSDQFVEKYRERFAEKGYAENKLYPDIPEVIESLLERNYVLGICTSKRGDFAETILQMFGLRDAFAFISGGNIGIKKFQQIESLLADGLIRENAVMIGDRYIDIIAGHKNGLKSIGVLWGYGSREELEAESPDYLLKAPVDLLDCMQ